MVEEEIDKEINSQKEIARKEQEQKAAEEKKRIES